MSKRLRNFRVFDGRQFESAKEITKKAPVFTEAWGHDPAGFH